METIILKGKRGFSAKAIPQNAGVYLFKSFKKEVIYIGKAKNLRSRLKSYFSINLSPKTAQMVSEAHFLSFIKVDSEIEALLLEASLVRSHMPKYNSELKDDKSPLYIGITKDKYPRIISLRKTELSSFAPKIYFGPFVDAGSVRMLLALTRKIFPYATHKVQKRGCIYSQIGLCNPCPSEIENTKDEKKKEALKSLYFKNIKNIKKIFEGKLPSLKRSLEIKMKNYAKKEKFEKAQKVRAQIRSLEYVSQRPTAPFEYIKDPNFLEEVRQKEMNELKKLLDPYLQIEVSGLSRIECFDNAHLAGTSPTASMVTFINGEPDKTFYRHFKIMRSKKYSDVDMMREVLKRRSSHFESWGQPDLIIVDGGKPQVSAALSVISGIPVIGLAKRYETIIVKSKDKFIEINPKKEALHLLSRIRDEAHRFARRLHHKRVSESMLK